MGLAGTPSKAGITSLENVEISKIFEEIAHLLELESANPFRIRSYHRSAQVIGDLPFSAAESVDCQDSRLKQVAGIGSGTLSKIEEILDTGSCSELHKLRARIPVGLLELLKLRSLGPQRIKQLWKELAITSMAELETAITAEKLRALAGFGPKTELKILDSIRFYRERTGRIRLDRALELAESLLDRLTRTSAISKGEVAGSLRRRRETIGDLDLLVISDSPAGVRDELMRHDDVRQLVNDGETKITVRLEGELNCDVRILARESFGAGLQYFTGSKEHNVVLRERARRQGFSISEYGLFTIEDESKICGAEEAEIYQHLGLAFVAPELRENRGELEAARNGTLPQLVELTDFRGELHNHTPASDGRNSLSEMVDRARALGYEYIGITDHSHGLAMIGGLDEKGVDQQLEEIAELNSKYSDIRVLSGIEVEILEDGSLDLPPSTLQKLDVVIASVHSHFNLTQGEMTRRLCRALEHPEVNLLGHPTGRILFKRDPYPLDLAEVMRVARENRVCLELNSHPKRLDLHDINCRMARDQGVLLSVNSDCHSLRAFAMLRFGVYTARRGWLTAEDVINTYPLERLFRVLAKQEYR